MVNNDPLLKLCSLRSTNITQSRARGLLVRKLVRFHGSVTLFGLGGGDSPSERTLLCHLLRSESTLGCREWF